MQIASGVLRRETEEGWEYLLMEKRSSTDTPYLDYIGGSIEEGEEAIEAFLREFDEETNVDPLEDIEEVKVFEPIHVTWNEDSYDIAPYDVKVDPGFEPEVSDEHEGYRWVDRSEVHKQYRDGILSGGRMKTLKTIESTEDRYQALDRILDNGELERFVREAD